MYYCVLFIFLYELSCLIKKLCFKIHYFVANYHKKVDLKNSNYITQNLRLQNVQKHSII
jgi:hypothetical protein